jgi:hypothetical protein
MAQIATASITFAIVTRATIPVPVVILPLAIRPIIIPLAGVLPISVFRAVVLVAGAVICFAVVRIKDVVMATFRGIWLDPGGGKDGVVPNISYSEGRGL